MPRPDCDNQALSQYRHDGRCTKVDARRAGGARFWSTHVAASSNARPGEEVAMDNAGIDGIARELFERLPEAARSMRRDIESNFRAVLQTSLGRLDLTTRAEFEVQAKVLERTRERAEQLERRLAVLEKRVKELGEATPPIAD
jgi:ubiquinone biosynthesis accessory factor UbiK